MPQLAGVEWSQTRRSIGFFSLLLFRRARMGRHGLLALIGGLLLIGTALGDTKTLKVALQLIEEGQDGYIQELMQLVAIPSVSALPERLPDIRTAAEWVRDR